MARATGRNPAISWIVVLLCTAVVAALIWMAVPFLPAMTDLVGDMLRQAMP